MQWFCMRTSDSWVVSSNSARFTSKPSLVRKVIGNHLIKSTSLEENSKLCLWFLLCSKSSMRCSSRAVLLSLLVLSSKVGHKTIAAVTNLDQLWP